MPFDVWCCGCGEHIARGVRFNAEKRTVGSYLSTRVFSFLMPCPRCAQPLEIRTDPEHRDYVCVDGARRKSEDAPPEGTVVLEDEEERARRAADPMYRLERSADDRRVGEERAAALAEMVAAQRAMGDDYALNTLLRRRVRAERKEHQAQREEARRIGLGTRLLPLTDADIREAAAAAAERGAVAPSIQAAAAATKRRLEVRAGSIFDNPAKAHTIERAAALGVDLSLFVPPQPPLQPPPQPPHS